MPSSRQGQGLAGGKAELKPEIRFKIYNEAIGHYEKGKVLYQAGEKEKALKELHKAVHVFSDFPEAYALIRKICLDLGDEKQAGETEKLFRRYRGSEGASLYRLRDEIKEQIENQKALRPPPDIPFVPSLLLSFFVATISIFGMYYEYRLKTKMSGGGTGFGGIVLEPFPSESESSEFEPSLFFKLLALFLPGVFFFILLLLFGLRHRAELGPILMPCWVAVDLLVYLVFFADFSDVSGMRRTGF